MVVGERVTGKAARVKIRQNVAERRSCRCPSRHLDEPDETSIARWRWRCS
jgi:hypothetical protein